jgi:predicted tellurium resistance membrane protein TerC
LVDEPPDGGAWQHEVKFDGYRTREHPWVLIFSLILSLALLGPAATFTAHLLHRHRWIADVVLAVILHLSLEMTYRESTRSFLI